MPNAGELCPVNRKRYMTLLIQLWGHITVLRKIKSYVKLWVVILRMTDIKCSVGKAVDFLKSIGNPKFYFRNLLCSSPMTYFSLINFFTYRVEMRKIVTTIKPIIFVDDELQDNALCILKYYFINVKDSFLKLLCSLLLMKEVIWINK